MRRFALASLALAFTIGGAHAVNAQETPQPRRPRAEGEFRGQRGPGAPGALLFRGIELSDAQKQQVKAILEKHRPSREQMEEARARGQRPEARDTAAMRQRHAQAMQERAAINREIRAVLTREQQAQFDKNVAEMNARMKQRMEGRGKPGKGGERGEGTHKAPAHGGHGGTGH